MKKKVLLHAAMVIAAIVCVANADVGIIDYSGSWQEGTIFSGEGTDYQSLTGDSVEPYQFYGVTPGGDIDAIYHSGSWQKGNIVTGNYTNVLGNMENQYSMWAAKASGGLDYVYGSGGWHVSPNHVSGLNNDVIISMADESDDVQYYALTNTGTLKSFYYSSGTSDWVTYTVFDSTNYTSIAGNTASGYQLFAARADGGIDTVYHNGSSWVAENLSIGTAIYLDIARDGLIDNQLYAARADGGVDIIYYNGSSWQNGSGLFSGTYGALGTNQTDDYYLLTSTYIPEPATMGLLLVGGVVGFMKRRKK